MSGIWASENKILELIAQKCYNVRVGFWEYSQGVCENSKTIVGYTSLSRFHWLSTDC